MINGELEKQFWERIIKGEDPNDCWKWVGAKSRGYGGLTLRGESFSAHRLSYQLHHGPIAEGMFICHRCDNPECCNPKHLFQGTPADNVRDMISKGRHTTEKKIKSQRRMQRRSRKGNLNRGTAKAAQALHKKGWSKGRLAKLLRISRGVMVDVIDEVYLC
jgi:HNH endonuclease